MQGSSLFFFSLKITKTIITNKIRGDNIKIVILKKLSDEMSNGISDERGSWILNILNLNA